MKRQIVSLFLVSLTSLGASLCLADEWDSTTGPGDWDHEEREDYERGRIERRVDPSTGDLIISARLAHHTMGSQLIDLERLLGLESASVRGRRLEKVAIEADARFHDAMAQLLVNGVARDGARRISTMNDREVFVLGGRNIMGLEIQRLQLALRGDLVLTKVAVRLSRGSGGGWDDRDGRQRVIQRLVSQHVNGSELLRIRQILDLGSEDTGLDIERLTVMGNSQDIHGRPLRLQLLINGMRVGAAKLLTRGSVSFVIPEYRDDIGSDIRSLQVLVEGRGYIHAVSAVVEREYNEHDSGDTWIINF